MTHLRAVAEIVLGDGVFLFGIYIGVLFSSTD